MYGWLLLQAVVTMYWWTAIENGLKVSQYQPLYRWSTLTILMWAKCTHIIGITRVDVTPCMQRR